MKQIIRESNNNDINKLKKIWLNNFKEDPEEFVNNYFDNIFKPKNCMVISEDNKIISSIHFKINTIIVSRNIKKRIGFLFAIATDKNYQRQGNMAKLINKFINSFATSNKLDDIYIQAYNPNIYKNFGFVGTYFNNEWRVSLPPNTSSDNKLIDTSLYKLSKIYNNFTKDKTGYRLRNRKYFINWINEKKIDKENIFMTNNLYLSINLKNNKVSEIAWANNDYFKSDLGIIMNHLNIKFIDIILPIDLNLNSLIEDCNIIVKNKINVLSLSKIDFPSGVCRFINEWN